MLRAKDFRMRRLLPTQAGDTPPRDIPPSPRPHCFAHLWGIHNTNDEVGEATYEVSSVIGMAVDGQAIFVRMSGC